MGPDWKLDRRDSGRLFWRRDSKSSLDCSSASSASTPPSSSSSSSTPSSARERVKFRYDVEVLEFWETDDALVAAAEDAIVDRDRGDAGDAGEGTTPTGVQSVLVCMGCIGVILATISYQWLGIGWLSR